MNNHKKTRKGFTLIELLTVMAILALLAVVILVSLNSARAKARDTRRKNELHQIQLAMIMWYETNNNTYPIYAADACSTAITGCTGTYPSSIGTFLVSMPKDPTNDATHYYRVRASDGSTFCVIATNLEQESAAYYVGPKGGVGATGAGATSCP